MRSYELITSRDENTWTKSRAGCYSHNNTPRIFCTIKAKGHKNRDKPNTEIFCLADLALNFWPINFYRCCVE